MMNTIKISLAAARVNAGMTQEEVAKKMRVSKNTVVNWEKQKTEPSIKQGRLLAELYDMPMENIFFENKSNLIW